MSLCSKVACKTYGKTWSWNPIPWNFIQHQQTATTKPYQISLGIIIYGSYSFFFITHSFFPRPSLRSDHQQTLTEKHTARTYSYLFLYILVHCFNQSINYFSGRPPFQILFTSPSAYLPFSLVYWMEEKTENVAWILEEAQLSIMLWHKFHRRVLQVSHWKHLRCSRKCIKSGAAGNYLNLTDVPDDLKRFYPLIHRIVCYVYFSQYSSSLSDCKSHSNAYFFCCIMQCIKWH